MVRDTLGTPPVRPPDRSQIRVFAPWVVLRSIVTTVGVAVLVSYVARLVGGPLWLWVGVAVALGAGWLVLDVRAVRREAFARFEDPKEWLRDAGDTPQVTVHQRMQSALVVSAILGTMNTLDRLLPPNTPRWLWLPLTIALGGGLILLASRSR